MDIKREQSYLLTQIKISKWTQMAKNNLNKPAEPTGGKKAKGDKEPKKEEEFEPDTTPKGEKKDCSKPMINSYQPKQVEAAWYDWWEKKKFFSPNPDKAINKEKKAYTMVIPPPNVTGALHLGHALMLSIEDAMIRQKRMKGFETLWLPGCDHAGIATQSVVEKKIMKDEGKLKQDYGREQFVNKIWEWKEEYGGKINNQFRRFGISVDWDRFAFTMDADRSIAVTEAFCRMYKKGLIYRSTRLVNWSCKLRTAISDQEVDYIDIDKREMRSVPGHDSNKTYEFGVMIKFDYKIKGSDKKITVATTRLETMLGDVAVAVHPDDERYKDLHGKELEHPFIKDRKMTIITDPVLVDMAVGTGAVKITPAHDPNDYESGRRHNLPEINIFDEEGKINNNGGEFAGMMRFDARVAVYEALDKLGQIQGKVDNKMRLGLCSRTEDVIEPMLKPQWYADCTQMAKRSADAVRNKELIITPSTHEKTWFHYLDNIQPWCISRQLWWGHRIPVYLVTIPGVLDHPDSNNPEHFVCGRNEQEAKKEAAEKFKVDISKVQVAQDDDVLDTWFSSGLFPFSSMGWPNVDTKDMKAFYPGDILETGHDILFFWVARMVMMSLELCDKLPFKTVFLHPMVKDEEGRKMSKAYGNVIDPLEVMDGCTLKTLTEKISTSNLAEKERKKTIEAKTKVFPEGIPQCGTDALRFGLLSYMVGSSINLSVPTVVGYRNFCNKLWNIFKFSLTNFSEGFQPEKNGVEGLQLSLNDKWILTKLSKLITLTNERFDNYDYGNMTQGLYDFWLKQLADYYVEAIKPIMKGTNEDAKKGARNTLYICLDCGLRMLHPTMPYITEELFQRLPHRKNEAPDSICIAPFPETLVSFANENVEDRYNDLQQTVVRFRNVFASINVGGDTKKLDLQVKVSDAGLKKIFDAEQPVIEFLVKSKSVTIVDGATPDPKGAIKEYVDERVSVYILQAQELVKKALVALEKKMKPLVQKKEKLEKGMNVEGYEENTPQKIRDKNAQDLEKCNNELAEMLKSEADLKSITQ